MINGESCNWKGRQMRLRPSINLLCTSSTDDLIILTDCTDWHSVKFYSQLKLTSLFSRLLAWKCAVDCTLYHFILRTVVPRIGNVYFYADIKIELPLTLQPIVPLDWLTQFLSAQTKVNIVSQITPGPQGYRIASYPW